MIEFDIRTNVDDLKRRLTEIEREEVPFATARALTDVAFMVRAAAQDEMRRVFRNPTAWTLNGLVVVKAEKNGRPAQVYFEDAGAKGTPAGRYLRPQMEGGGRGHTPFERRMIRGGWIQNDEFLVPGKYADRNAAGDVNPGQVTKILSDLGTVETAIKGVGSRNRGKRAGERYQVLRNVGGAPSGIYRLDGAKRLLCFLIVRQPQYRARFDFKTVAQQTVQREFARAFRENLARAVKSSRSNPANMKKVA